LSCSLHGTMAIGCRACDANYRRESQEAALKEKKADLLLRRLEALEARIEGFRPCDECGVVFATPDDWASHLCNGRQGR
jgi:hypothetical protein